MPIQSEAEFRAILTGEKPGFDRNRRFLERLPSPPRCKLCSAPFAGPGGTVLRHFGYRRFAGNPSLCENCIRGYSNRKVRGAEIPLSMLFADIRGSTALGERLRPSEFGAFLEHFYRIASEVILHHDGIVDKLVGDEVVGPVHRRHHRPRSTRRSGDRRRSRPARAGAARRTRRRQGRSPSGRASTRGEAYVGIVGAEDTAMDFTALGDPVNTAARLASAAAAGELLITADAARAAGIDLAPLRDADARRPRPDRTGRGPR